MIADVGRRSGLTINAEGQNDGSLPEGTINAGSAGLIGGVSETTVTN
jgi:hypothetical protein